MEIDVFEGSYSDSTIEGFGSDSDEIEVIPIEHPNQSNILHADLAQNVDERSAEAADNPNEIFQNEVPNNENAEPNDDALEQAPVEENQNVPEEKSEVIQPSQSKSGKRSRDTDSDDDDDDDASKNVCPICMDKWTNAGDHRLVCLKCGHLFGNSCIIRWLEIGCPSGQRRCPQCNKKAHKKDIRTLYAHNLQALDTSEYEKLQEELNILKQEKARLETEIARVNLNNKLQQEELKKALNKVQSLEKSLTSQTTQSSQPISQSTVSRMVLESTLEISNAGGCRVLTWNSLMHELYISHSSTNNLFPGFSVRKVSLQDGRPVFGQCVFLHTKAIRDLAVRPQSKDLLLSVSLDKTAKLMDLSNNSVVNKFNVNNPLWSCCWDCNNLNRFFVGSQNGNVFQFDSRQPNSPLQLLAFPGDLSPVTSVVSLPYCAGRVMPQGGILVSKLVSCWAFSQNSVGDQYHGQQLPLEGPFTSLCHEKETDHILISKRPNARNPNTCHMVCQLEQEGSAITCNVVHSFLAGTAQMQLSRPCLTKVQNDMFVSAYIESRSSINVWNVTSGQIVATVKAYDPVKDICAVVCNDKLWLAALSEKTLRIYSMT
ncbi:hypothetical protein R5R35_000041 [Gryllus longicercus]|uniref:RING-type E3 ubiquitin transferase n=1 Tax=Gryllus longicercus TaxID=2509291 RepID=A0AAN9Z6X2_9ORTH